MLAGSAAAIDFSQEGEISMDYSDRFTVILPYGADFPYKLTQMSMVIEQLEEQGDQRPGTIDMTSDEGRINFIPN